MKSFYQFKPKVLATFICCVLAPSLFAAGAPPLAQVEAGPIGISCSPRPANYSFDPASGKAGSAAESAENAVASLLTTPHLGNPQLDAALGVVEFAVSPFVAGYSAIKGGHQRLDPDQLAHTEEAVRTALAKMAEQLVFREYVVAAAKERTGRDLQTLGFTETQSSAAHHCRACLTVEVDQLRLHRVGSSDKSFRLEIAVHAALVRSSDGVVICRKSLSYQSGDALFVDWGRFEGLESVARTGYQHLASELASEVFTVPTTTLARLGESRDDKPGSGTSVTRFNPATGRRIWQVEGSRTPSLTLVGYQPTEPVTMEIMPELSSRELHVQGLTAIAQPTEGTPTDTEYALDGLENHPNFVVQVAACFGAIPMGLWEHTVGAFRSGSEESWRAADTLIKLGSRRQPAQSAIAEETARLLTRETSASIRYNSLDTGNNSTTLVSNSSVEGQGLASGRSGKPATVLHIRTVQSRLSGKPGRNPRLQLCIEIEAVLVRTSDGQELVAVPVSYQTRPRRLQDWAAHDGRILEQQLAAGYTAISRAIVDELAAGGFIAPADAHSSTWAAR